MTSEATLLIGAATGLVTASAHAFVLVSKELRAWRAPNRKEHGNLEKSTRDGGPRCSDVGIDVALQMAAAHNQRPDAPRERAGRSLLDGHNGHIGRGAVGAELRRMFGSRIASQAVRWRTWVESCRSNCLLSASALPRYSAMSPGLSDSGASDTGTTSWPNHAGRTRGTAACWRR
jgi:hypothetical protein